MGGGIPDAAMGEHIDGHTSVRYRQSVALDQVADRNRPEVQRLVFDEQ